MRCTQRPTRSRGSCGQAMGVQRLRVGSRPRSECRAEHCPSRVRDAWSEGTWKPRPLGRGGITVFVGALPAMRSKRGHGSAQERCLHRVGLGMDVQHEPGRCGFADHDSLLGCLSHIVGVNRKWSTTPDGLRFYPPAFGTVPWHRSCHPARSSRGAACLHNHSHPKRFRS